MKAYPFFVVQRHNLIFNMQKNVTYEREYLAFFTCASLLLQAKDEKDWPFNKMLFINNM